MQAKTGKQQQHHKTDGGPQHMAQTGPQAELHTRTQGHHIHRPR